MYHTSIKQQIRSCQRELALLELMTDADRSYDDLADKQQVDIYGAARSMQSRLQRINDRIK